MKDVRKLVAIVRVSTDEQAEEGVSLEAQRAKLQAYAGLYGIELVAVEIDAGVSGKGFGASLADTLEHRPGLARALSLIRKGEAGGILVYSLSRLTRSVRDLGGLVEQAKRDGWDLVSLSEQIDTASAAGRLVLHVLGAVSAWEREACGERTSCAMRHKASKGEYTGGRTPYGWAVTADGVSLEPVEAEQEAIRLAVALREEGLKLREIAAELAARGWSPRKGGAWTPAGVWTVLRGKVAA